MKRWQARLSAALMFACAGVPQAHAGNIYKCVIKGATVYRDQPCSPGKPEAGKLSKTVEPSASVRGNSASELIQGLRALSKREREQHKQYDREVEFLRMRMADVPDGQVQQREVQQLNGKWKPRFAQTRRQREALLHRLRKLCPNGASDRAGVTTCHR